MKRNWKSGFLLIAALSIASLGGRAMTNYMGESEGATPVQVDVSSLDSNGLTVRDFNMDFLRTLQAYINQDTKEKRHELDHASYQADYVQGEKKLAVIRLQTPSWNSVDIVGFVSENLARITCTRSSAEMIAISHGPCSEKIDEVFGMRPQMP